jgi:hypothetical protein
MSAGDLVFDRGDSTLSVYDAGKPVQQFEAHNLVDSRSKGIWPAGTYGYQRHTVHADDAPDSAYGSYGNFIFDTAAIHRTDMGVHSGRASDRGTKHPTMGCIRTTDKATLLLSEMEKRGGIKRLTIIEQSANSATA